MAQWLIDLDLPEYKSHGIYADTLAFALETPSTDCIELLANPTRTGLKPSDYNREGLTTLSLSGHVMSDELSTLNIIKILIEKGGADPNA